MSDALKNSFKNKTTVVVFILFTVLILACGIISFSIYEGTTKTNKFFFNEVVSSTFYEVNDQYLINSRLNKLVNSKDYSLKEAYVELNPYKISPLSGIIIFQTGLEEEIRLYINNEYVTTMEASKKHIIPIYGLLEDYENIVKVESSTESQEYILKTERSNLSKTFEISKNNQMTDNLYFASSSDKKELTGWDTQGRLRFYLIDDNSMDVEWLPNNHMLIGTTQGEVNNEYLAFVEMDYLGKIYNYYTTKHGVSREIQVLDNGNLMLQGGDTPIVYNHQVIYTMDPRNGSIIKSIDLFDIIKNIDSTFNEKYLSSDSYVSGFYYDEKTNDLVVANRDGNIIFRFNYDTKKLNWILTNPTNPLITNDVWKKYLIELNTNNYPVGPSGVEIKNNVLSFINSNFDRYKINELNESTKGNNYKNTITTINQIVIDKDSKKGTVNSVYNNERKQLSISDGQVRTYSDGTTLISFGSIVNNIKNNKDVFDANITSRVVELNNNKEVIFDASVVGNYYRIYKNELYSNTTNNIKLTQLKQYNSIPKDKLTESSYKKIDLDKSVKWNNSIEFTANSFKTDYTFNSDDKVELLLVNRAGKIFILDYLNNSNKQSRVFNISLPVGEYALFIKVNNKLYNANRIYKF